MDYAKEYAQFVKAVVERYDGDGVDDLNAQVEIKYWQRGNEYPFWENERTLDEYLAWAKLTSTAIKEADPEARVVLIAQTQGFTAEPWLKTAIQQLAPQLYRCSRYSSLGDSQELENDSGSPSSLFVE